jgi:hypothetical protein
MTSFPSCFASTNSLAAAGVYRSWVIIITIPDLSAMHGGFCLAHALSMY